MDLIKPEIRCYSIRIVVVKVFKVFYSIYNKESVEIKNIIRIMNEILNSEVVNGINKENDKVDYMLFCKSVIDLFIEMNSDDKSISSSSFLNTVLELIISSKADIRLYSTQRIKKLFKEREIEDIIPKTLIIPILKSLESEKFHIIPHKYHLLYRIIENSPQKSFLDDINKSIKIIQSYVDVIMKMNNSSNSNSEKIIRRFLEFICSIIYYSNELKNEIELMNCIYVIMLNNMNDSMYIRYSISKLLKVLIPINVDDIFFRTYLKLVLNLIDDDNELVRENINKSLVLFLNKQEENQSKQKRILYNPNNMEKVFYDYLSNVKVDYKIMRIILDPLFKEWKDLSNSNEENDNIVYDKDEDSYYTEKYCKFKNIIKCYNNWKKNEVCVVEETKKNASEYVKNKRADSTNIGIKFAKLVLDE